MSALNAVDGNQGSYNESILEQLIPNETLLRIVQLYEAAQRRRGGRRFNSAILQTYNMLDYMQDEATDKWVRTGRRVRPQIVPTQQQALEQPARAQAFTQKVKNYVTTLYVMRAILGFVSPISADVEPQNFGFTAKLQDAINKAGSVARGFTNFFAKYPDAAALHRRESFVPNAAGPAERDLALVVLGPGQKWMVDHQAHDQQGRPSVLWLMPQLKDAKYSSTVYNEQIADGLRVNARRPRSTSTSSTSPRATPSTTRT